MPEAAVDEDDGFVFGQNNVGFAREIFNVQAKAVAHPMEQAPDDEFGGRVFTTNAAHVPGAACFGQAIPSGFRLFSLNSHLQTLNSSTRL